MSGYWDAVHRAARGLGGLATPMPSDALMTEDNEDQISESEIWVGDTPMVVNANDAEQMGAGDHDYDGIGDDPPLPKSHIFAEPLPLEGGSFPNEKPQDGPQSNVSTPNGTPPLNPRRSISSQEKIDPAFVELDTIVSTAKPIIPAHNAVTEAVIAPLLGPPPLNPAEDNSVAARRTGSAQVAQAAPPTPSPLPPVQAVNGAQRDVTMQVVVPGTTQNSDALSVHTQFEPGAPVFAAAAPLPTPIDAPLEADISPQPLVISIDRIDIRINAEAPAQQQRQSAPRHRSAMSLDDFLTRRDERRS